MAAGGNYLANLIARNQAASPEIRPAVAPLFSPSAERADFGAERGAEVNDERLLDLGEAIGTSAGPNSSVRTRREPRRAKNDEARDDEVASPFFRSRPRTVVAPSPIEEVALKDPTLVSSTPRTTTPNPPKLASQVREPDKAISVQHDKVSWTTPTGIETPTKPKDVVSERRAVADSKQQILAVIPKIVPQIPPARPATYTKRGQISEAAQRQTIRITIGRVDVRLVSSDVPNTPPAPKQEAKPTLALDDYLLRSGERS
jgi:hypothetical protein